MPYLSRHVVYQVSDLHLSRERAYAVPGWRACLRHIAAERPDLVVATGDHVLDDPDDDPDRDFARAELGRIATPWRAVPGNHDIGDNIRPAHMGQEITAERLARWHQAYGDDRFVHDVGRWRLIGINAILFGTGLPGEAQQAQWLAALVDEEPRRPIALFLHKPLALAQLDEGAGANHVAPEARRSLLATLSRGNLRLVASGHWHQYRTLVLGGVAQVWAPSAGFIGLDLPLPTPGTRRPGMVGYAFDGDDVVFQHIEPPGLVGADIMSLWQRHRAMRHAPPLAASAETG
jgi:3',5'-cyclic AMP phosphodiesterase CpdA